MEDEVWLPVPGYVGLYEVSDRGRVRSLDRMKLNSWKNGTYLMKGRVLSNSLDKDGYVQVSLYGEPGTKPVKVKLHRLVALTHLNQPLPEETQVNHINFNRVDNSASNLEWCTPRENMVHSSVNGRLEGVNAKLTKEQVERIHLLGACGYTTRKDIASEFGIGLTTVSQILLRKTWAPRHLRGVPVVATGGPTNAKLTEDDVRWIKREGVEKSSKELQAIFGVSQPCISLLRTGKTWSHIT